MLVEEFNFSLRKWLMVAQFEAQNDVRYYLIGTHFCRRPVTGDALRIEATDGYRLARHLDAQAKLRLGEEEVVVVGDDGKKETVKRTPIGVILNLRKNKDAYKAWCKFAKKFTHTAYADMFRVVLDDGQLRVKFNDGEGRTEPPREVLDRHGAEYYALPEVTLADALVDGKYPAADTVLDAADKGRREDQRKGNGEKRVFADACLNAMYIRDVVANPFRSVNKKGAADIISSTMQIKDDASSVLFTMNGKGDRDEFLCAVMPMRN